MISRKTQKNSLEKQACISLFVLCLMLFSMYIYFISASIVHVVIRTETNQEMKKVSSEISLLEGRFIAAQHKVSADIASLQGYTVTSKKIFIDRTEPVLVLSDAVAR